MTTDPKGAYVSHRVNVEKRWNGWRVWCDTCSNFGIYDDEAVARQAAVDHQPASASADSGARS